MNEETVTTNETVDDLEEKKNKLNAEIRSILAIMDLIDGKERPYENYVPNTLNDADYVDQQTTLVAEAKQRLLNIFSE